MGSIKQRGKWNCVKNRIKIYKYLYQFIVFQNLYRKVKNQM
jgi:hypothetical protein